MLKKRIPTIVGIFLLLLGITLGVYLVQMGGQSFSTKAGPGQTPSDIRITNVTDNSFTVSWRTEAETLGFLHYGTKRTNLNLSALDERDKSSTAGRSYKNHYVSVSGLLPETLYYFEIISGDESLIFDNGGQPYTVTTGKSLQGAVSADTAYGTILYSNLAPADGALVYVTMTGGAPLSSLSGSTGTWAVPLSSLRTFDLADFLDYDRETAELSIEVLGPEGSVATAVTTTINDSPVKDIILGSVHDFTGNRSEKKATATESSQFKFEPLTDNSTEQNVKVNNPLEGEKLNSEKPEFLGEGPPGTEIEIVLESNEAINKTVVVDDDGSWSWTAPTDLEPLETRVSCEAESTVTVPRLAKAACISRVAPLDTAIRLLLVTCR